MSGDVMRRLLLLTCLMASSSAWAGRDPGEVISPAVAIDLTPEGLDQLDVLASGFLPESIPIPELSEADEADEDCIDLWFDEICWIPWAYGFELSGLDLQLSVDDIGITLGMDVLELDATVSFTLPPGTLNLQARAADVDLFGLEFAVIDIDEQCTLSIDNTPLNVATDITLILDTSSGTPDVTVDIAPVDLTLSLQDKLNIDGCTIGDIFDFVDAVTGFLGNVFNFDVYALITDAVEPLLDGFIADFLGDLETTLEDVLASIQLDERIDLLGKTLALKVAPTELVVRPEGLRFALEGSLAGNNTPDPCVSAYPQPGSLATGTAPPALGDGIADLVHHAGLHVDDDFVNQALYAIWYEGLLCFTIDSGGESPIDLPIPLDTSLLGILAQGAFDEFFPDPAPIAIATRPTSPPVAAVEGQRDIDITVDDFGLDLYAELDGRMVRAVGLLIDVDAGVDLAFDGTTGDVGIDLDLGAGALSFAVGHNDLAPEANEQIVTGIGGLVDTLLGSLLGGLTSDLGLALPSLSGFGVSELVVAGTGPDADFLGVLLTVGEVPYEGGDLGDIGGEGCGLGCATGGAGMGPGLLVVGLLGLRRRRGRPTVRG